ncbi:hypothetical protein DB30_05291 [Enhygromyxa salina]|uniref:DUF1232 domain-containing protein n=1 Tax=Enhygromyxa salina TaxID=215803 RepID=A0A0C2CXL4_9BACT|nr:DUF1232 domain-containing protein [Enhygromyxa salina]KIG15721.1 hypothetical protein DB30_05291 [Enhygromyxa salina]
MSFEAPDFRAEIRRFVHGYVGAHQDAILRAGDVFDFYARLMIDTRVSGNARVHVACVLAYFVVPDDVLPEAELGPYGLLDDLYLAAHVYKILRRELPRNVLSEAWGEDDALEQVMDVVYAESRAALGKLRKDVLRVAGLA